MAHTAFFKFQSEVVGDTLTEFDVDVIPPSLTGSIADAATFKAHLVNLYTNEGGADAVGQGKAIFANTVDGINAPVLLVNLLVIQHDAGGDGNHHLVFHLLNISDTFQIEPAP